MIATFKRLRVTKVTIRAFVPFLKKEATNSCKNIRLTRPILI